MKTGKQIREMFPVKFEITKEIIKKGTKNILNPKKCIGALCLKKITGLENAPSWVFRWGSLTSDDHSKRFSITTEEGIDMTELKTPTTVTFKICSFHENRGI